MIGKMPDFNSGLDMLKTFWTGMGVPPTLMSGLNSLGNQAGSAMMPPMNLDELDKRINDLKTVESWLTINMNLLRGSIQTLEVQRNTAVALKSFTDALAPEVVQTAMQSMARAAAEKMQTAGDAFVNRTQTEPPPPAAPTQTTEANAPVVGMWWNLLNDQFQTIARSAAAASELGKAFTPPANDSETSAQTTNTEEPTTKRKPRTKTTQE